jgi:S-(hydroxymethyl)glutathione dehydrogenase / alcohol dehydrogenase
MRAAILVREREPLVIDEVQLDEPRDNEVLVKVAASGVCHSCLHSMDGSAVGTPLPMVLGDEGAGVVERVGPGVTSLQPGDHVILSWAPTCGTCRACTAGRPATCENPPPFGVLRDGKVRMHWGGRDVHHFGTVSSYASEVVVPEDCAIKIRSDMPLDVAALIGCAMTTGLGAVTNTAGARPGESVAVFGCGGVGLSAVMGAALVGAYPIIAVDLRQDKLDIARRLGATHLVDASKEDPTEAVKRITGRGVEHAIVAVGVESAVQQAWESLATQGTCVLIAFMGTGRTLTIEPTRLIAKECRLVGSRYGSSQPGVEFPRLVELYMAGRLPMDELITKRYPLDEINEAHRALAAGENARGLIVFDR